MYDLVIIGAGTAGLSAAIYAMRAGLSTLVLEGAMYGGQIIVSPTVENYPGIASVSGAQFAQSLYEQAEALGAQLRPFRWKTTPPTRPCAPTPPNTTPRP